MIRINFRFSSCLLGLKNIVHVNGNAYELEKDSCELSIELEHESNTPIVVTIHSSLIKDECAPPSFGKRLIAALTMMLIASCSMDIYDCDCSNYRIELLLWIRDTPNVDLYVNKVGQGSKGKLACVAQGGVVAEKNTDSFLDRSYAQALFKEYHQLNRWRTGIWTVMLLFLTGMGIITCTVTTIIFSVIFLCLILLGYIYTKRYLRKLYAQLVGLERS